MKKFTLYLGILTTLLFISCEGPEGPPGRDGANGLDGANFEAAAFEIEVDLNFNPETNSFDFRDEYPSDIDLIPDDVILMYRLEAIDGGTDIWRQMPQPFFTDNGLLYYNFDFTQFDYTVLLEPDFDPGLVTNDLIDSQIFRIVVVPSDLGTAVDMDQSNINSVMSALGVQETDFKKIH